MVLNHGNDCLDCCAIWELSGFDDRDDNDRLCVARTLYTDLVDAIEEASCADDVAGIEGAGFVLATLTPDSPRYAVGAVKLLGMKLVSKNKNPRTNNMLRLYHATGATIYKNLPKLKAALKKLPKPKLRAHDWDTNSSYGVTCRRCFHHDVSYHDRKECNA